MTIRMSHFAVLMASIAALLLAEAPKATRAGQATLPFSEAELFLELNDTDGDLGIHSLIDGGAWTKLQIVDPNSRPMLDLASSGPLQRQGLTQLSLESVEPPFDELAQAAFFRRFPEGEYRIRAATKDGDRLESPAVLSHVLAAPPENVLLNGTRAAESCDARPLPRVSPPVSISWDPVTESHPEIGKSGPIEVSRYELIVEGTGERGGAFSLELPPDVTQFELPTGVTALGNSFKFEIIVRTDSGNNTAVESCFRLR
jgi:hypothetical protein